MLGSNLKQKLRGMFGYGLSEHGQNRIKIEEPEHSFEEEFDINPLGGIYLSQDWTIQKVNLASIRMFAAQPSSIEQKSFLGFIEAGDVRIFMDNMRLAAATAEKRRFELRLRKLQGDNFSAECSVEPVFDEHGKLEGFRMLLSPIERPVKPQVLTHTETV